MIIGGLPVGQGIMRLLWIKEFSDAIQNVGTHRDTQTSLEISKCFVMEYNCIVIVRADFLIFHTRQVDGSNPS